MIEPIRVVKNYTLCQKSRYYDIDNGEVVYYIDNGEDVSEYFDIYEMKKFLGVTDEQFIELCETYL